MSKLPGVVFITGAGSGIGRATAKVFAEAGCKHLVLVDINEAGLTQTVKEHQIEENRVTLEVLDVLDDKAVEALIESIPTRFGSLDYAINCAGIAGKSGFIEKLTMEEIDLNINVNLRAQIVLNRAEAVAMLKSGQKGGSIVNMASVLAMKSSPHSVPYSIAKHGVIGLTKGMAVSFARNDIRVNGIAPGFIDTPMAQASKDEKMKQSLMAAIPQRRIGDPSEVAGIALFLCSESASYMNGSIITVDGGYIG